MKAFESFLHNYIVGIAAFSYIFASFLKILVIFLKDRKINWRTFLEPGGMPSAHSALVTSLCTTIGKVKGFDGSEFAVCLVFALIVMYDAFGVRRAAGEHASAINLIIETFNEKDPEIKNKKFREILGHTPLEVVTGAIFGVIISLFGFKIIKLDGKI